MKEWLRRFFDVVVPHSKWKYPFVVVWGFIFGFLLVIVVISNAGSYLSDEPKTCVNCHIMSPHYATWFHSSHREWANCNDCHVPHENFIRKYFFKASDGSRHATIFTLRLEPQVIMINEAGKEVVQNNCLRCHIERVNPVSATNVNGRNYKHGEGMLCWECHREVPHGRVLSEASTPYSTVLKSYSVVPGWLKK